MKYNKPVSWNYRTFLRSMTDRIQQHGHLYTIWDGLFFLSSAAFLLFWVLVHALVDKTGSTRDLPPFLRALVIALGVGGLLYLAVVYLPGCGRIPNIIANIMLINVFLFTLLIPVNLMIDTVSSIAEPTAYFSAGTSEEILLVNKMIANSRFWGAGDPVALHPDTLNVLTDLSGHFWFEHPLTTLAYVYGSWIVLILFLIVGIWCISAIRIYMRIYSRWFEWVFIICFLAVANEMMPALLVATGILPPSIFITETFYYSDTTSMVSFFALPLAAMFAIIKRNNDSI